MTKPAMYKFIYYCLVLITTSLPLLATTTPSERLTSNTQTHAIKVGDTVANNDFLYRKIIEITAEGYYKVQNFYKQIDSKQSDIFVIKETKNLNYFQPLNYYNLQNLIFDGPLTLWSINGHKALEITVSNGNAEGLFKSYDGTNGNIEIEGNYKLGRPEGLWQYWDLDGNIEKQIYYKAGVIQWQKDSINIKGI
ncbi:toxin-antitoxin system YwqK family antitoxin [Entomomonas asaccharolytica]|uniref:Uncharacterized protein n=1 Tax=Entomomonas asaccharolytica TaxID=2785331 RepID=A0A974NHC4_9GAMM|nr:hypothetical protein [Entomomonas asaccharolytica]QQP86402.1 hypothetical protein JHT90_03935 [Entomomonas asaccharolytica]